MKTRALLLLAFCSLLFSTASRAQCNATYVVTPLRNGAYEFQANYTPVDGYTYSDIWNLGLYNGTVTGQSFFQQTFYLSGTYNICHILIVQDSLGLTLCNDTSCQQVLITVPTPCIPQFSANGTQTQNTFLVSFTNSIADYTNLKIVWNYGDGTSDVGIASPTHIYPAYNTYNFCLYATDTVHGCVDSACSTINVDSTSPCAAYQYGSILSVQPWLTTDSIVFTEWQFANSGYGITWNFGDGAVGYGDSVAHTYLVAGEYQVCVYDTNALNGCTYSVCKQTSVDTCSAAFANFTIYPALNMPLQIYHYSDSILPPGTSATWNYGNGIIDSTGSYSTVVYPAPGLYTVCLSNQIPGCGAEQTCDTVTVGCNLDANFSYTLINGNTISYLPSMPGDGTVDSNVVYHWFFGDGAVSTEQLPTHVYSDTGAYNTCLIVTDTIYGCSDTICQQVQYSPWTDTICGTVFIDLNGNGIQDTGEAGLPNVIINLQNGNIVTQVITDANGNYQVLAPYQNGQYLSVYTNYPPAIQFSVPFIYGQYLYFQFTGPNQRQCGFDFGVLQGFVAIEGTVYGDDNHNGLMDNNESGIPNQLVDVGNNQQVLTLSNGVYLAYVDTGNYTLQKDASGFFAANAILPATLPVYIPNYSTVDTGLNFGVQTTPGIHDVAIDLLPLTPVSPGYESFYAVEVTNLTSQNETFADSLTDDPGLIFDNVLPSFAYGYDSASNTLNWQNNNLGPFGTNTNLASAGASMSYALNQDLYDWASVTIPETDNNPTNNFDTCHQIVVGPFDPNGKTSNQAGKTAMAYISTGQTLKYSIEFQNTGNSDAVNVIVKDVLDPGFDLKTFRFIGANTNAFAGSGVVTCDVKLLGDTLYVKLSQIMLQPKSVNAVGSIGWISYAIQPKATLAPETELHNTASIYFDRNAPIKTNTTLHTIQGNPNSVQNIVDDGQLYMAPNPFSTQINFRLQNMPGDKYNYTVTDVLGRTIVTGTITTGQTATLYRNTMSAGTYFITFFNDEGIVKRGKIVAE